MLLEQERFRTIVESTPLLSIDLLIRDAQGRVLLGRRRNRPAQGFWFVPGGRVLKNESLDAAFRRLTLAELGHAFERGQAQFLNVHEHFYADSMFGAAGEAPDTHYVVLCYGLNLPASLQLAPPADQHDRYRWWSVREMQDSAEVHAYTRAYLPALD